jgi:tetratricopeptide (TPR) repeat protein/transcriptional regulator with XRE-family HTH domain
MVKEADKVVPNRRLQRERVKRGWSQQDLARLVDTSSETVSRWERGLNFPHPSMCKKLCELFAKSPQELGLVKADTAGDDRPALTAPSLPQVYDPAIPLSQVGDKGLVGRAQLLADLKRLLCSGKNAALSALNGLPGVGKTALAVKLAREREVLDYFRDGVLWVGLGLSPNLLGLLGRWGTLLGLAPREMETLTTVAALAKTLNSVIGTRRMLLVIDDAWRIEDALAFQVGGVNCAHLVTTRFPEIALQFAHDGSTVVHELSEGEGMSLLARLAPEAVASKPGEVRSLIGALGGLPLALTLVGKYLWSHFYKDQPYRLSAALSTLQSIEERLRLTQPVSASYTAMPAEAPLSSLQAVINLSDQHLAKQTQDTLRALSIFPAKPNSFPEEAALAVALTPVEALDTLADAGLLEGSGVGRYTLHQTIADYARLQRTDTLVEERMVSFYSLFVEVHATDYDALEREMDNILAAFQIAYERKMPDQLLRGVVAFALYLEVRGLYSIAETQLKRARQAALDAADHAGLAFTLLHLGRIAERRGVLNQAEQLYSEGLAVARQSQLRTSLVDLLANLSEVVLNLGEYERAEQYAQEGLDLARELGDQQRMCVLLKSLAEAIDCHGHFERGDELYREGLALAREIGDREMMCLYLQNMGAKSSKRGNYEQAMYYYQEGLSLARQMGHRQRMSALLSNMSIVSVGMKHYAQAEAYCRESFSLARTIGHGVRVGNALQNLGIIERERGNFTQAEEYFQESLDLARAMGHRWLISETLCEFGECHLGQHKVEDAFTAFAEAHTIARGFGGQELVARALYGLARIALLKKDFVAARQQAQESLAIFETERHEKVAEVKQLLAALENSM